MTARIVRGDVVRFCRLHKLRGLPRYHALLCDVPYGLSFMGQEWDSIEGVAFDLETWRAIADTLLPGAYLFVFAGNLNDDLISVAMRRAGLVKQHKSLTWSQGSSLPKTTQISTQVDKRGGNIPSFEAFKIAMRERMTETGVTRSQLQESLGNFMLSHYLTDGDQPATPNWTDYRIIRDTLEMGNVWDDVFIPEAEREVVGKLDAPASSWGRGVTMGGGKAPKDVPITAPATELARTWAGHRYGSQNLRNLIEAILIFRKPYEGKAYESIVRYGAGALAIEKSRISTSDTVEADGDLEYDVVTSAHEGYRGMYRNKPKERSGPTNLGGRHPSNFYITHVTLPVYRLDDTHPLGVKAYIRGYFDGYTRVADLRTTRGVADAQADAGTLEVIAQDIPQPWLEYFMQTKEDLGCVRVGTKRVRDESARKNKDGKRAGDHKPSNDIYGLYRRRGEAWRAGDADGLEVVSDFDCARDESGRFICPVALLDEQAGERGLSSGGGMKRDGGDNPVVYFKKSGNAKVKNVGYGDTGGPSRFLHNSDWSHEQHYADATSQRIEDANAVRYVAKPSKTERDAGLRGHFPCVECGEYNTVSHMVTVGDKQEARPCRRSVHPTRKPIKMMQYLCTLLSVPDAYAPRRLFVPFCGEGSEVSGAILSGVWEEIVGVDSEPAYVDRARVAAAYWQDAMRFGQADPAVILANAPSEPNSSGDVQLDLFDNSSVSDKAHDMLYERAKFEEAAAVLKMCVICGFEEDGGNTSLDCGVHYMCDEHLLQGDALDHECDEYNDKSDAP